LGKPSPSGNSVAAAPDGEGGRDLYQPTIPDQRAARAWPQRVAGGLADGGREGRSGGRPQPTRLKLLRGNPGKRPAHQDEPEPDIRLPEPPEHLSDEAKREWGRVGALLLTVGLVSELDRAALAGYCQAWGRWVEAEEALRQYGVVVKSPSGYPMQSPFLAVANKAVEQMRAFLVEFGMTPASRTRVHAERPRTDNPLAPFLRRDGESQ
jgi:P27 family predicted phage terminase small subunit